MDSHRGYQVKFMVWKKKKEKINQTFFLNSIYVQLSTKSKQLKDESWTRQYWDRAMAFDQSARDLTPEPILSNGIYWLLYLF